MGLLEAVDKRVDEFLRSTPVFQTTCKEVFEHAVVDDDGKLSLIEAAQLVDAVFVQIQAPLLEYGIKVDRPTKEEVIKLFEEGDENSDGYLDCEEFQIFYAKLLKYGATKFSVNFSRTYGIGILSGVVSLILVKRFIGRVPIAGGALKTIFGFIPTKVVGPLLGMAVVYGYEKGDLLAAQKKFFGKRSATDI